MPFIELVFTQTVVGSVFQSTGLHLAGQGFCKLLMVIKECQLWHCFIRCGSDMDTTISFMRLGACWWNGSTKDSKAPPEAPWWENFQDDGIIISVEEDPLGRK